MSKSFSDQLDEIFDKYDEHEQHDEYHVDCDVKDGHMEFDRESAKASILALIEKEVIGEQEEYPMSYQGGGTKEYRDNIDKEYETAVVSRNVLRIQQRNILKGGNK